MPQAKMEGSHNNSYAKKQYFNDCGILPKFHPATFDNFENDAAARNKVKKYLQGHKVAMKNGYGLFLYGENGRGKTHLMMALLKELALLNYSVRSISLGTLIKLYTQENWYNGDNLYSQYVKGAQFLEIEEIGKEYKSGEGDLGRLVVDSVVRLRLQLMKPLLFTTNLSSNEIGLKYSKDIASMLNECCLPIEVTGVDWRPKNLYRKMNETMDL